MQPLKGKGHPCFVMSMMAPPDSVVIIGGGIVGCATAHYLRKLGGTDLRIVVIDKVGIAASASGRAGGFLARDWHGGPVAALAAHSFGLHADLAAEFGAEKIGYRSCQAVQPRCCGGANTKDGHQWYNGCKGPAPVIAPRDTAAQVIPARLTEALFASSGAELVIGTPSSIKKNEHGDFVVTVTEAEATSTEHACKAVLLACGAWTSTVAQTVGVKMKHQVYGLKAHSVLFETSEGEIDDSCLFLDWRGDPTVGEFEVSSHLPPLD